MTVPAETLREIFATLGMRAAVIRPRIVSPPVLRFEKIALTNLAFDDRPRSRPRSMAASLGAAKGHPAGEAFFHCRALLDFLVAQGGGAAPTP